MSYLLSIQRMKGFELTPEQQQELRAALAITRNKNRAKDSVKINALLLLGTGWTLSEVSDALFLDTETIRSYVSRYKAGGLKKVLKALHRGSSPRLSSSQLEALCEELDSEIYLTTAEICVFVEREFDVKYTISGMTDLLHRLGYSYKKPKVKSGNPDLELQECFLNQFTRFLENKGEDEALFFMDAVHPVHNSMPAYGWFRKGQETQLKTNSGRERLNIHGAINAETFEIIPLISKESVNTESTVQLLSYLEQLYPKAETIYVILDNARYHYSEVVQEFEKKSRVKLVFLPPYSPELNLIERIWRVFKKNVLYNKYYETFDKFKQACVNFFTYQEKHYDEIASIMGTGLDGLNLGFRT